MYVIHTAQEKVKCDDKMNSQLGKENEGSVMAIKWKRFKKEWVDSIKYWKAAKEIEA